MPATAFAQQYEDYVKYIHNHDIMSCTADGVIGNHLYSGRALGITERNDMIQLHPDLKPFFNDITAHYDHIGLTHTKDVIWYLGVERLASFPGYHPSVFFFGPEEYKTWGDYDWYNTVDFINSKNNFMALAKELGIDVPKTLCFENVSSIDEASINEMSFPCYLKAAISVSGVGIYRCETKQELRDNFKNFDNETPVQLQEEVITNAFLNMQYKVVGNEIVRLACSEQILEGCVHQGNRVPTTYAPWESVDRMALWLKNQGMRGIFAFDVAVVKENGGLRFPAIECNPRFNGATYPTLIAHKLDIQEWCSMTYSTKHEDLKSIDLSDIEYNPRTKEGAIIVNWGTILTGKLMFLLAGSEAYQDALHIELQARL